MLQLLKILLTYISLQQKLVCYSVSTQKLWQKFSLEFFLKEVTRVMQEKVNNSVIAKCFLDPLRNLGKPQGNYCKKKKLATAAEKNIVDFGHHYKQFFSYELQLFSNCFGPLQFFCQAVVSNQSCNHKRATRKHTMRCSSCASTKRLGLDNTKNQLLLSFDFI